MWLLNADIFGRKCCETVTADSGKLRSFVLREKKHEWKRSIAAPTKHNFYDCCRNTEHFRHSVERAKRFVNVHLHCIVSNMNRIRKMSRLPPLEKFLRTPMTVGELKQCWRGRRVLAMPQVLSSTVRLLPKDLAFEQGSAKRLSCPRRHLTPLHLWGSAKVFNVALLRICLPTTALVSFWSHALYQENRCKLSVSHGSINVSYDGVVCALSIRNIKGIFLLDFKFTEWFQIYCRIGLQLTSDESWNTFNLCTGRTLIRPTWRNCFLLSGKVCEIID